MGDGSTVLPNTAIFRDVRVNSYSRTGKGHTVKRVIGGKSIAREGVLVSGL